MGHISLSPALCFNEEGCGCFWGLLKSGFRKRGLANCVSPFFFLQMKRKKTEENGRKRKENKEKTEENRRKRKKTEENGRKRKETEKIGSDTVPATLLRNPDLGEFPRKISGKFFRVAQCFRCPVHGALL